MMNHVYPRVQMLRPSVIIAAGLLLFANRAAHAQRGTPAIPWSVRSAGIYNIVTEAEGRIEPARLILRDSSGTLSAVLEDRNGEDPRPLSVVKINADALVLRLTVPSGSMAMTLARRGDSITGTWQRAGERGVVTGRVLALSSVHAEHSSLLMHAY